MTTELFEGYKLNKYQKIYFDSIEEAAEGYDECIDFLLSHPGWVLKNLDHLKEFQVPWLDYHSKEKCKEIKRNFAISHPYFPDE